MVYQNAQPLYRDKKTEQKELSLGKIRKFPKEKSFISDAVSLGADSKEILCQLETGLNNNIIRNTDAAKNDGDSLLYGALISESKRLLAVAKEGNLAKYMKQI